MSSQDGRKRCIIQKLDFENCIITNSKTTARGRKKLRARITREIERIPDIPETQSSTSQAPVQGSTSPVLIKKQCRDGGSPAFVKRKKMSSPEQNVDKLSEDSTIEEIHSSPGSPVFRMSKKPKITSTSQDLQDALEKMKASDALNSQGNSSAQIEEFTQECKLSVRISSFGSSDVKNDSIYSIESGTVDLNTSCRDRSGSDSFNGRESPKPLRRNYKKNSLLGRLKKLQQKRASEKLLSQHQNRKNSSCCLKLSTVSFWKEEFHYFLKCRSILPESETNFLIVDNRWVPNVKNVKKGSTLHIYPPWQELRVDEPAITVLLNIICLDVVEETEEPVVQKRTFESDAIIQFESDHKSFVDSLFSAGSFVGFW